ncbi:uncharacterized protein [Amphiura filiformis]|uniref:uncharacterized protein n=1 Tax=Amphiura filiformis TaxID=82378 RepID=UPI003B2110F2
MEKYCPTKLRAFIKFKDEKGEDPTAAEFDNVMTQHPEVQKVGSPIISTQGAINMVRDNTTQVASILTDCDDTLPDNVEPCNKETGERGSLNLKSRGFVFIVSAGGHIQTFSPIYRSESPSQVFLIILSFLYLLFQDVDEIDFENYFLAYDNMCNVMRLKVAKMSTLPLMGKFATMWTKVKKIVDGLHIKNHKRDICKVELNPEKFKTKYPDISVNSMAAEQTFAWTGRYKKQICSLPKRQQIFMLHRLCKRRNMYTEKCHAEHRDPLLPGKKIKYLSQVYGD